MQTEAERYERKRRWLNFCRAKTDFELNEKSARKIDDNSDTLGTNGQPKCTEFASHHL